MEEWRDIKWYEWRYKISNLWRVFSLPKKWRWGHLGLILSVWKHRYWYCHVVLSKNGLCKQQTLHRLVAQAFMWLDINNTKICVCHKDETLINWLLDNSLNNLWLWSHLDNMKDRDKKWRQPKWSIWIFWIDNPRSKKINQYTKNWELVNTWNSIADVVRELWIYQSSISNVCAWRAKTAWGFIWKFI